MGASVEVVVSALVMLLVEAAKDPAKSYTTRFDAIDVEVVLSNERILKRYVDCALDRGPCTAEGRELKKRIPEALKNDCAKCSKVQRRQAQKALQFLVTHKRRYWDQLTRMYDPDGVYRKKYGFKE